MIRRPLAAAAVAAVAVTTVLFVFFIVILGFRAAPPSVQRVSTGYGIRALGLEVWAFAHVVYALLLVAALGPATRVSARREHPVLHHVPPQRQ